MDDTPPQASNAVAVPVFEGLLESPHCNCASDGQMTVGCAMTLTVTVFWHALLQPLEPVSARLNVNDPTPPALTVTVWLLVAPLIVPLPEIAQLYEAMPA